MKKCLWTGGAVKINRKVISIVFISISIILGTFIFFVLPQTKSMFIDIMSSWTGEPVSQITLTNLHNYFIRLSIGISIGTLIIAFASVFVIKKMLEPVDTFVDQVRPLFSPSDTTECTNGSSILQVKGHANIINSVPMGIVIVDDDGLFQMFNKEASAIANVNPVKIMGSHLTDIFPTKFYNKTMEVILTGKEHLNFRSILKTGDASKEILVSITPLRSADSIFGAVIIFQDVSPQQKISDVKSQQVLPKDPSVKRSLDAAVNKLANLVSEIKANIHIALFLADKDNNLLIMSHSGMLTESVEKYNFSPENLDTLNAKKIFNKTAPLICEDIDLKPEIKPFTIMDKVKSMCAFPVVHSNKLIGMVNFYGPEPNFLPEKIIQQIQSVVSHLNSEIADYYNSQRSKTLATLDSLTGLYNKNHFLSLLKKQISESLTSGSTFSLAVLDIDQFKIINDTLGYQQGDKLLKEIAGIISINLQKTDISCRYDGEEFSILMNNTSKREAVERVRKIAETIAKKSFQLTDDEESQPTMVTISGGVVNYPDDTIDFEELLLYADIALYTAKKEGRNKVMGYRIKGKKSRAK